MKNRKITLLSEASDYLRGKIQAPPSKSYTIRALIIAALATDTIINNPLICDDTQAAREVLLELGAKIKRKKDTLRVEGFDGKFIFRKNYINVGESGTLLRLILPVLALSRGKFVVNGRDTLLRRSNTPIVEALRSLGVNIKGCGSQEKLPIVIRGKGRIAGGKVSISAKMSSQTLSSLLTIAPFMQKDTKIIVKDALVSRPYVDITIDMLKSAGIKVKEKNSKSFFVSSGNNFRKVLEFEIHGDYSSSAFLIAAACLVKSDVTIYDLVKDNQGDRAIIDILRRMGARISFKRNTVRIRGPFNLRGIDINCRNTPDLVPILCVIGSFAKGQTRILDIGHLAHKESNRITAPANELKKLGARIKVFGDSLLIMQSELKPGCVWSANDHRIAMALAVCGLKIGKVEIKDAQCIDKSYPNFVRDLKALGANIRIK